MKNKVLLEDQVVRFIQTLPPDMRKRVREALHEVEAGKTFPEPLEDELDGFYKLKVERIRIICQTTASDDGPVVKAVFAERRKVVYELFSQIIGLE